MKAGMRLVRGIAWMSLAACGFPRPADLVGSDAGVGLDANDSDNDLCLGNFVHICVAAPTQPLVISEPMTLDTMTSPLCVSVRSGGAYCVVAATDLTIFRPLRATGKKPLVLLARGTITTGDTIDVGSHRAMVPETGAGADPASCSVGTLPGTFQEAAGGGAGGSFAGMGGNGGASGEASGGISGAVTPAITELRGGCAGQDGAHVINVDSGLAGHGGGAVYFIAGNSISLHGDVLAGGEGGGGVSSGGGAGGGAGGMIGFDAPSVTVTRAVVANGGGGGEGGDAFTGTTTHPGQDAVSFLPAPGGAGGNDAGGNGGSGAAGATAGSGKLGGAGTMGPAGQAGGGGGGGGAGVIKAPANANLSTSVSPPATP